ncbi:AraC family transcriptional regulator [Sphingomonas zeicaulis]|uniref:helix-turn-helix domain-containing protein n=1 Tax=Sphingomonas zeicaulis TaxID=1632740 RepID=UPI003D1EDA1B
MTDAASAPSIAAQTLRCMSVIPTRHRVSSRDVGWRSLLLDLHSGVASSEPYESVATTDPRVGITISGRYSAEFFTGGKWRYDAHGPGSINIHRTGEQTRYRFPKPVDGDFKVALVYYPLAQLEAAADHLRRPGQSSAVPAFHSVVGRDPVLTQIAFALADAMKQGVGDFYAETAAAWLAVHMLTRHAHAADGTGRSPGDLSDQRLARVIEFMSAHFAMPLTLEQLAAEACISKFHFARLFARKVGQTPYRFLTGIRLDAASRMLITTDLSISQVGAACGFPTSSHFSTAFANRFGMSARDYRLTRPSD